MYQPRNPKVPLFNKEWDNKKFILIGLSILIIPILSAIPAILWR